MIDINKPNYDVVVLKQEYFELMVSGEKKWEFRKLSKGIESGDKLFVTRHLRFYCDKCEKHTWDKNFGICVCGHDKINQPKNKGCVYTNGVVLGCAYLEPRMINPNIARDEFGSPRMTLFTDREDNPITEELIDEPSFNFVKENYLSENITEFIAFKISNVESWK